MCLLIVERMFGILFRRLLQCESPQYYIVRPTKSNNTLNFHAESGTSKGLGYQSKTHGFLKNMNLDF